MNTYDSKLKECVIVSTTSDSLRKFYAENDDTHDPRYKLATLNKTLNNNEIEFLDASNIGEIKINYDYCLMLEDEAPNIAQLIMAASESEMLETIVICQDIKSAECVLQHINKMPLFISLDFLLSTNLRWYNETKQIYTKLKRKWNDVPVIGITQYEFRTSSELNKEVQDIISNLRKNGDSVYDKSMIWDALPNIFRDKFLIGQLRAENKDVQEKLQKVTNKFEKLQKEALGIDISKRIESKDFKRLERRIVGESLKIKEIRFHIELASRNNQNILILGETGTGKELVARAIHHLSKAKGKFVAINCAALPDNLLEAELFGYEKGAFTGAKTTKKGLFEIAKNGTIFLDELHMMSLKAQGKLLRAVDEKKFTRLGGVEDINIENTRILAAAKPNVEELISNGQLIEDLFARLDSFMPPLPTLNERKEDIPVLVDFFLSEKKSNHVITDNAMKILQEHEWKRNVRELRNFIFNLDTLYSFIGTVIIDEDQVNYALSLHKKTGKDAKLIQKMIGHSENKISEAFDEVEKKNAKELLRAIIDAIEKYPSKEKVSLKEIASKITTPGTGKTGVTPEHLSTKFNKYKKYYQNLMNTNEFSNKLTIAMKYRRLKQILTT